MAQQIIRTDIQPSSSKGDINFEIIDFQNRKSAMMDKLATAVQVIYSFICI